MSNTVWAIRLYLLVSLDLNLACYERQRFLMLESLMYRVLVPRRNFRPKQLPFWVIFAGNYHNSWLAVTDWPSLWCNLDRINAFCHIIFYKMAIKPLWDDVFVDSDRLRVTPYGVSQSYTYSSIISVLTKVFLFFSFAIWNDRVDFNYRRGLWVTSWWIDLLHRILHSSSDK